MGTYRVVIDVGVIKNGILVNKELTIEADKMRILSGGVLWFEVDKSVCDCKDAEVVEAFSSGYWLTVRRLN